LPQQHSRGLVFDLLGDGEEADLPRQPDNGPHERLILGRLHDVENEIAVDLHEVDAERPKRAERGLSGAKIVDRKTHAEGPQGCDEIPGLGEIAGRCGLGNLDEEPCAEFGICVQGFDQPFAPFVVGRRLG
jgi:hypothetical protein